MKHYVGFLLLVIINFTNLARANDSADWITSGFQHLSEHDQKQMLRELQDIFLTITPENSEIFSQLSRPELLISAAIQNASALSLENTKASKPTIL